MSSMRSKVRHRIGDQRIIRVQRMLAPTVRRSLGALARVYLSDKGGFHAYTEFYQRHFAPLRQRPIRLLEIGIGGYDSPTWGGASLRMWRDYFRHGEIHGLDIEEKRITEPRIHVHRGDQSDQAYLRELARRHGPFDVIIDDGSHVNAHIRASFEALFVNHLRPGGYYVVEDMSTAYLAEYGGGPPGHPGSSVELIQSLLHDVNRYHWPTASAGVARPVRAVHTYEKIAFVQHA
ncbi:class I SAM-dependent methyltransferase [Micromonospora sp. NPDC050397]|uniref:class I SAM-dependent methyltransferase n=1 Tax=Micromonospora sp. NPDC050397 TaxID=3364279 RepID=UPI00384FD50A